MSIREEVVALIGWLPQVPGMWLGWVCGAAVVRGGRCANNVRGMSSVLLLLILAVIVDGFPQQTPASIIASNNQCIKSCPRTCSPACLPTCCSGSGVLPAQAGKPEMMVTSVEEGETEEVQGDKGFGNPDDDSCDPPGTITIPLPPTVYEPPKAGEEPKEMPLPEFKLPAAIFEGKIPSESMTLSPEGTKLPPGAKLPLETAAVSKPPPTVDLSPPAAAPLLSAPAASFPPPPPPLMIPLKTPVLMPPPPPPPPPPAAPPIAMSSGGSLPYPKLPPVTISEIPNRSNRQPPLLLPKKFGAPAPLLTLSKPEAPAISLPKPPPIHVSGEVVGANTAATPQASPPALVPAAGKSNAAPAPPPAAAAPPPAPASKAPVSAPVHVAAAAPQPVHKYAQPVVEKQQDMRFGVSYGKAAGKAHH